MPRSQLDPVIVDRVEKFWAEEGHKLGVPAPSRRSLYVKYLAEVGNELSWGSFSTIAKRLEEAAPKEPLGINYWRPWVNPEESTEDTACLLKINAVMRAENGRNLYDLEARWACKLRGPLQGVPPFGQCRLVMQYVLRELRAYYLQKELYTDDLDNLVAYQPWSPPNQEAYHFALARRLAPYPDLDPFGTLRKAPPPPEWLEEWLQRVKHTWLLELYWILLPWGTHIPGIQDHQELVEVLDWVVEFWGRPVKKDQSTQGPQDAKQTDAKE
jgi:hypothetical protein